MPALIERLRARHTERPDLDCDPDPDIEWAKTLSPPKTPDDFALEIIFVICNSGMRFTTARRIYDKVVTQLVRGLPSGTVFGHAGKAKAIDTVWLARKHLFQNYNVVPDKLAFIEGLPWIGEITKYHVAKNFGLPYAKPDVHLQRLADTFSTTPQALCETLAKTSGYSIATVDTLLWRAAACGVLDTGTGKLL